MDGEILEKSTLFQGLDQSRLARGLDFFEAEKRSYPRGSFLNQIFAPLPHFGLVLSGTVRVFRDDIKGYHMILANVSPGGTFGESLCFLGREADVYISAVTDVTLLWLKTQNLHNPQRLFEPDGIFFYDRFTAMLAERALGMNDRIQILSQITIREKLIAFFSQYSPRDYNSLKDPDYFEVPFDRSSMAHYLGTDRSALSRELGRMRSEGYIEYSRNRFKLLGDWGVSGSSAEDKDEIKG